MDFESAKGVPIMAAFLILVAVVILGGISFGFQGSVQF